MTTLQTAIWHERPEPADPFAVRSAECFGFDVYADVLGNASWADMLHLLFTGRPPAAPQRALLDDLAVALANPGPRDPSVHAAMSSGVSGSPAAATLMAALAAGAGQDGGGRDVFMAMLRWEQCGADLAAWETWLADPPTERDDVWPVMEHPPGFEPHGVQRRLPVEQTLARLVRHAPRGALAFLREHADALEAAAGRPISTAGVAAAAYADLGFSAAQGEMVHLMLRLPGAAAHALEQHELGFKRFPFPDITLLDDPERDRAEVC
jgi:citrate synthase